MAPHNRFGLSRQRRFIEDRRRIGHYPVYRHDLAGFDQQQVSARNLTDGNRDELFAIVAVGELWSALQQRREFPGSAGRGIVFERPASREHQGNHGAGQILVKSQSSSHRHQGDHIDTEGSPPDRLEYRHRQWDQCGDRRGRPRDVREAMNAHPPRGQPGGNTGRYTCE